MERDEYTSSRVLKCEGKRLLQIVQEMWLAMLMLATMASGFTCPDHCQCRSPRIECRDRISQAELQIIPTTFTELVLRNVTDYDLVRFEWLSEKGARRQVWDNLPPFLQSLQVLEVTDIRSRASELRLFKFYMALQNVRVLNISHNRLTEIPGFRQTEEYPLNQLRVLDASYNDIQNAHNLCKFYTQLTWLSLANNKLDTPYLHVERLQSLEYLDLSNNILHTLEGLFNRLYSLQRLYLAGNKLEHVQASWFQNCSKLVELDISRNKLTFIPADTLQPLASLSIFKLAENPLIERDLSLLLGTGRRLEVVDASRIGLLRVPAALTRSVRTLKLSGNQLTSINSGDLDSYPLLRLLDLTDNRLIIIEEDALGRLDSLEELMLSGNILPTIPKSLPRGLKLLDLKQNAISKLAANDLQELNQLKELNLSGNVIFSIEGGFFRQLPELKILDISDNPIKKLPSDTLSGPSNLVVLRMSGLMLLEVEENQNHDTAFPFLTPENLVKLDVSRSPVLAAQLLADNAALSACKSLQELDLSYTNINSVRSDLAYVLPQLKKLNLIGNEWNCSTDQFWLGEWIRQHNGSIEFSTRCEIPVEFEGKLLKDLPSPIFRHTNTTKITNIVINTTTSKPFEREYITTIARETLNETECCKIQTSSYTTHSSTPKAATNIYNAEENVFSTTNITEVMNLSTTAKSTTTTLHTNTQDSVTKNSKKENESQTSVIIKKITLNNKKILSLFKSENKRYSSEANTQNSTIQSPQLTTEINLIKSNQNKLSTLVESNTTFSSNGIDEKVTKDSFTTVPTSSNVEVTTKLQSTVPSTTIRKAPTYTTKMMFTKPKQSNLVNFVEKFSNTEKDMKQDATIKKMSVYDKKSTNHMFSDFSHSKLLFANEEAQVNDEPSSFAEELNSQATESGARTSESLASGAHPGMLVLLGAAIGAAVALTVVLSRRATVNKRDRQYQRHENIEVHALTPTTELW